MLGGRKDVGVLIQLLELAESPEHGIVGDSLH